MLVDKIDVLEAIYAFDEIEGAKDWNDLIKDGNSNPQASKMKANQLRSNHLTFLHSYILPAQLEILKGYAFSRQSLLPIYWAKDSLPLDNTDTQLAFFRYVMSLKE